MALITLKVGNLLHEPVDAIVNPAHPSLLAGSGLCGQIHLAAGRQLEQDARQKGPIAYGQALMTQGYKLAQPWVIHASPPKWLRETQEEWQLLLETFAAAVRCAGEHGLQSMALPAMGIGINRFPLDLAASATAQGLGLVAPHYPNLKIHFVLMSEEFLAPYDQAFRQQGLL